MPSVPEQWFVTELTGGASRLAALLLPHICRIGSVVAPGHPGATLRDFGHEPLLRDTSEAGCFHTQRRETCILSGMKRLTYALVAASAAASTLIAAAQTVYPTGTTIYD